MENMDSSFFGGGAMTVMAFWEALLVAATVAFLNKKGQTLVSTERSRTIQKNSREHTHTHSLSQALSQLHPSPERCLNPNQGKKGARTWASSTTSQSLPQDLFTDLGHDRSLFRIEHGVSNCAPFPGLRFVFGEKPGEAFNMREENLTTPLSCSRGRPA
jgi:hypothetical protein